MITFISPAGRVLVPLLAVACAAASQHDIRLGLTQVPGVDRVGTSEEVTVGNSVGSQVYTDAKRDTQLSLMWVRSPTDGSSGFLFGFCGFYRTMTADPGFESKAYGLEMRIGAAIALNERWRIELPLQFQGGIGKQPASGGWPDAHGTYGALGVIPALTWTPIPYLMFSVEAGYQFFGSYYVYDNPNYNFNTNPNVDTLSEENIHGKGFVAGISIGLRL